MLLEPPNGIGYDMTNNDLWGGQGEDANRGQYPKLKFTSWVLI